MMPEPHEAAEASFSPDLPITSASEDILNRSPFAAAVAKSIRNWNQKSSLVIGLFGGWGSGKTSIKNMVVEHLRKGASGEDQIVVVEFNPWQFTDSDHLTQAFFNDIAVAVGQPQPGEEPEIAAERSRKLRTYGSYLNVVASISKSLKVLLSLVGVPHGELIASVLEAALKESAEVVKEGAEGLDAGKTTAAKTLAELKRDVHLALNSLPRPVLVVLDDVDRLTEAEIRLVLQIIKANADFPNLIYLLLAQRDMVVCALEKVAPGHGEVFLDKIVQVPLTVPRIDQSQLDKALFTGLATFVDGPVEAQFGQERWMELYYDGAQGFFRTLRDVNRFLSSFGFHIGVFRSGSSFEVNLIDLFGLEVLREDVR